MEYNKRFSHKFFKLSLAVKAIDGFLELIGGFFILILSGSQISNFVKMAFRYELLEDPADFIANFFIKFVAGLTFDIQIFASIYLMVHGVIKLGLIIGLWKERVRIYPWAIGIFVLLGIYQIYQYFFNHSIMLLVLTVLDFAVVVLTWIEYRHLKNSGK